MLEGSRIPKIIYLQWFDDEGEALEVTWCKDKINDRDIKYVLVECEHDWIDAGEQVVMDAEVCRFCKEVRHKK